ncbi:hypothetical protein SAMN02745823_03427 [Sporobacter termitidis DSM 10068]|uniref:Deacetylase PdaC domain-containing protein n=1 Tax=Sporobacter termitidis DSM 10068 TaxID=1123282 RepID=A0A1M5ZAM8_9FIRM|nr:DUF4163 domain-containing protein [Sporobacter termitidis]SHI20953.1 hypothetical protein SAMN02745823_03427 [Sporobacter termitidis DSM 10068]
MYTEGAITIKYPQVVGLTNAVLQEAINKRISDAALRDLPILRDDTTLAEYDITGKIAYNSPDLISVYFEGYSNYRQAAHPNTFLYTVTIDVKNQKTVSLPELVKISGDFVNALIAGTYSSMNYDMTSDISSSIREYLRGMGTDYWLSELKNADTAGYAAASYLTKDALAVSVSVPHALGDHIEILLPYRELAAFKTDSPIWDYLLPETLPPGRDQ